MNRFRMVCLSATLAAASLRAEITPMDTRIEEKTPTTIRAEQKLMPSVQEMKHLTRFKERQAVMGTFSYEVTLPEGYHADPARSWPSVFLLGDADSDAFRVARNWAATNHMVLIDLLDARTGDLATAIGNFLSAHDDALKRFRLKPDGKYMIGTDACGTPATLMAQYRPDFQGLILVNARLFRGSNRKPDLEGMRRNSKIRVAQVLEVKSGIGDESFAIGKALGSPARASHFMYWGESGELDREFQKAGLWILGP